MVHPFPPLAFISPHAPTHVSYRARTYFDFEGDSVIAANVHRPEQGDEGVDMTFGLSSLDRIDALGAKRESARG